MVVRKGIFSGSFNPIHVGHLTIAEDVREALGLDEVVFLPAAAPWAKRAEDLAPALDRWQMVRLATAPHFPFSASRVEIDTPRPIYTLRMLQRICQDVRPSEYYCILGMDAFSKLPTWQNVRQVTEIIRFAVVERPNSDSTQILQSVEEQLPQVKGRVDVVPAMFLDLNATSIRERIASGRSIRFRVPEVIERYIRDHGLYRQESPSGRAR